MRLTEKDFEGQPLPWKNVGTPPDTTKPIVYTRKSALQYMIHLNNLPFMSESRMDELILQLGEQGWSSNMITNIIKEAARRSNWNYDSYIKQRVESTGQKYNKVSR